MFRPVRARVSTVIVFARVFVVLCLVSLAFAPHLASAQGPDDRGFSPCSSYYVVLQKRSDGEIVVSFIRRVCLAVPLEPLSDAQLAYRLSRSDREREPLAVALRSRDGRVLYQNVVEMPRWLRGEFHGASVGAPIDGYHFPLQEPAFVVRVPVIADTTLVLGDRRRVEVARFDLARLSAEQSKQLKQSDLPIQAAQVTGSPENRLDLLVMGDGYTAAQADDFAADVEAVMGDFFSISPYAEYANYFNVHSLYTPSVESGADHPPYVEGCSTNACCGDPAMLSDPLQGTMVDTAFDGRFCAANIHRLLVIDTWAVLNEASAVPDWDHILVLVNDPTYGGSGGYLMVTSLHSAAPAIAQHEFGHSFVGLADEYESPYPGYPVCSDISGPSCEVNVTDVTVREQLKWLPWISSTTPIPTEPEWDPLYADVVGLFEGARYQSSGMYRPGQNCIMRSLGAPYCQVPSQAYVLRLYSSGWGTPAAGISMIEPGSLSPISDTLTLTYPESQVFEASILEPAGGPPAGIQWRVDGVLDPLEGSNVFTYTPTLADVGSEVEIRLLVSDTTSLVHPAMAGTLLQHSHVWTVMVVGASPPVLDPLPSVVVEPTTSLPISIDLWAYASDLQTPDSGLTFSLESAPPPGAGVTIVDNRWLNVHPSTSWCGYVDALIRVTDPGGLWDQESVSVTVRTATQSVAPGDAPPVDLGCMALDCASGPGGTVTATVTYTDPASPSAGVGVVSTVWDVSSTFDAPFDCDLAFVYDEARLAGAAEGDIAGAARWDEANGRWEYLAGTVDANANTATVSGVTAFSPWLLLTSTPPQAVPDLAGARVGSDLELAWSAVTEDLSGSPLTPAYYRVYRRADEPYFVPEAGDLVAAPALPPFVDPGVLGDPAHNFYYVVTAVDGAGVESALSNRVGAFDQGLALAAQAGERAYNLVAVNLEAPGVHDADTLAAHVGPGVYMVLRHDAATQGIEWRLPGLAGSNFPVEVGGAYYLYLDDTAPGVWSLVGGVPPKDAVSFALARPEPGGSCAYNFITVPLHRDDLPDAETLAADIGGVSTLSRYDAGTQGLIWWMPGGGVNFAVRAGYPYIACLEAEGPPVWP